MNLLMITPENKEINLFRNNQFNNFTQLTMPYLAGFVPEGFRIKLLDEYNETIIYEKYDLVAITVNTPNALHAYEIARNFRALGSWVVLGGPHITLLPEEAILHADTIVIGEAEELWPQFLQDFLAGKPQKKYVGEKVPSLVDLPIPRRDLITGHKFTSGAVFASRGCPHKCSYCCLKIIYKDSFRTRPVEEVINDIKNIPNKHFVFWDDNFFADNKYVKELLKRLVPLKKKWAAQVTIQSCNDEELLQLAKKAGCVYLFLGLESFSEHGLEDANKTFNKVSKYKEIIDSIHYNGLSVQAGIVFGFDSDTKEVFDRTLFWCESMGIDGVTPSILTPFPGTALYENYKEQGRLLAVDWSYYNGKTKVAFAPKCMSSNELLSGYNYFRERFYSWKSIINRIARSKVNIFYSLAMNFGYRRALKRFPK